MARKLALGVFLIALAAVSWRGYRNQMDDGAALLVQAQTIACRQLSTCLGSELEPRGIDVNPFRRIYQFQTAQGPVDVTCRYPYIIYGEPACNGTLLPDPGLAPKADRYPHEIKRGLDQR